MTPAWVHSRTPEHDGCYWWGEPAEMGPMWKKCMRRIRWCVRESGYVVPRTTYRFVRRAWFQPKDGGKGYRISGLSGRSPKTATIWVVIRSGLRGTQIVDTVLHELAHVITWDAEDPGPHRIHSEMWGVTYARLYRLYFDCDGRGPEYPHYR